VKLLVGTDKGLFVVHSQGTGADWKIEDPKLPGHSVLCVAETPGRPAELLASARHNVWGAHLYRSTDGGSSWTSLDRAPHHPPGRHRESLEAVWGLAWTPDGSRLFAGIDPVGLFVSHDRGDSWQDVASLNEHATRSAWEPSRGIFAVHSICIDPAAPNNMIVAISAGGAYRSEDGGTSWIPANRGVRAENFPERYVDVGHNVHRIVMHARTGRLYRQCYSGTYRSDDGGREWTEITAGLPSDFGYAGRPAHDGGCPAAGLSQPRRGPQLVPGLGRTAAAACVRDRAEGGDGYRPVRALRRLFRNLDRPPVCQPRWRRFVEAHRCLPAPHPERHGTAGLTR